MDLIIFVGRLVVGLYFITHGIKHFTNHAGLVGYAQSRGMKGASAMLYISGVGIVLGGLALILGIFPDIAIMGLALFLILVSFTTHSFWKDSMDPMMKMRERLSFEANIALAAALLMALPFVGFWTLTLM